MFLGVFICILSLCFSPFVCDNYKSNEQIFLKLFLWLGIEKRKKYLNYRKDLYHILGNIKYDEYLKSDIFNVFSINLAFRQT